MTTQRMTYKGARKGPILVRGTDRQNVENNIREVQRILKINVKGEDGSISGIVWE